MTSSKRYDIINKLSSGSDRNKIERIKKGFEKVGTELRLSLSAQNPFTITSYSGMDPERPQIGKDGSVIETGIDGIAYPNPRTFLFGIDLKF